MSNKNTGFVSLVLLSKYMAVEDINATVIRCYKHLEQHFIDYEIVVIHEKINSNRYYEWDSILKKIQSTRVIELAFELDEEVAQCVGLDNSIGDFILLFNPERDPLALIKDSVEACQQGNDVITGVDSEHNNSIYYRLIRPLVSFVLKDIGYTLPKHATKFRCLTRAAVDIITRAKNCHHQIYIRIAQCGLPSCSIKYTSREQYKSRKTVYSATKELLSLIVFNSVKPLRWMSILGFSGSFFSFCFALYSVASRFLSDDVSEGWASIIVFTSFLFMLLFIILSFFGEYMVRLLDNQSRHEPYWILCEKHSSVMLNEDRVNIMEVSVLPEESGR
jgi:hypothetical protein